MINEIYRKPIRNYLMTAFTALYMTACSTSQSSHESIKVDVNSDGKDDLITVISDPDREGYQALKLDIAGDYKLDYFVIKFPDSRFVRDLKMTTSGDTTEIFFIYGGPYEGQDLNVDVRVPAKIKIISNGPGEPPTIRGDYQTIQNKYR